jgi:hypothetical protein
MKNTKWTLSKAPVQFPGLLSVEHVDDAITAIVVQGKDGPVRISKRDYGGLTFYTPSSPATEKRYKVSGTCNGVDVLPRMFKDSYDAKSYTYKDEEGMKVTEVNVVINDDGSDGDEES